VVEGILKKIRRTPLWRRNELLALIAISPFAQLSLDYYWLPARDLRSALGHQPTFQAHEVMSASHLKPDIEAFTGYVGFVPIADLAVAEICCHKR
jgi:hypothetical protein